MFSRYICTILPKTFATCKPATSKELILFKKCAVPTCVCRAKKPEDLACYPAAYFLYKKITPQKEKK